MLPEDAITISVFADGDAYCAVVTYEFRNIQESECGFGNTQLEAIKDLLQQLGLEEYSYN